MRVDARQVDLSLPPPSDFLWQYAASTPMAGLLAGADEQAKEELDRDVVEAWREYEVEEGMEVRQRIVVATALR